jgi:hypothetical protein
MAPLVYHLTPPHLHLIWRLLRDPAGAIKNIREVHSKTERKGNFQMLVEKSKMR